MNLNNWETPDKNIHLSEDEVHVWLCKLNKTEDELSAAKKLVSEIELEKSEKFRFKKDSATYLLSHGYLNIILSKYIKLELKKYKLKRNAFGKPFFEDGKLNFNLSHSGHYCLVGISNESIGVDIEKNNEKFSTMEIAEKYFSTNEYKELLKAKDRTKTFFYCWTRKEAYIKAVGEGLSIPLNSFDVSLDENDAKILRINNNTQNIKYQLHNLPLGNDYCGAVAYFGKKKNVKKYALQTLGELNLL